MSNVVEKDDRRGYLYRHIRHDKDEVFYVGIGFDSKESRAYSKFARNRHWKNIIAITNYDIEILFRDLPKELLVEKEKEFIKLYGRRDMGEGTLVNMTDGGDGAVRCRYKNPKSWATIKEDPEKYWVVCQNKYKPFSISIKEPNKSEYYIECSNRQDFVNKTNLSIGYLNILKDVHEKVITSKKSTHRHDFPLGTIIKYNKLEKQKLTYPRVVKTGMEKFRKPFNLIISDENGNFVERMYCEGNKDFQKKTKMTRKILRKLKRFGSYRISKISRQTKHEYDVGYNMKLEIMPANC